MIIDIEKHKRQQPTMQWVNDNLDKLYINWQRIGQSTPVGYTTYGPNFQGLIRWNGDKWQDVEIDKPKALVVCWDIADWKAAMPGTFSALDGIKWVELRDNGIDAMSNGRNP